MKKLFVIAALFASMAAASAQQFGVIGGMTLSTVNGAAKPEDNKAMFLYQAGVVYKMDLGAGFAIQPSLTYQVKGANLQQVNDITTKTGFAEFGIGAQWGPDLVAFRPFVFVEPFIGYGVTGKEDLSVSGMNIGASQAQKEALVNAKNKFEYGLGGGLGLEFAGHVVHVGQVVVVVLLVGVEAEEAAAVTLKRDVAGDGAESHPARLTGGGDPAVDEACVLTARCDLRTGLQLAQQRLRLRLRGGALFKRQAEGLHLPEKAVIDIQIHPGVVAKDRLPDQAKRVAGDLLQHVLHPLSVYYTCIVPSFVPERNPVLPCK
jgi:hypothetical protein